MSNHGFPFELEQSYRHDSFQHKVEEMLWFLVSSQNTQGIPALLIERINQKYSVVDAIITKTDESILENLLTWQHLKSKSLAAIDCFSQWEKNQNELSQPVNIREWLCDEIGANNFETDLIIKILSEKYT